MTPSGIEPATFRFVQRRRVPEEDLSNRGNYDLRICVLFALLDNHVSVDIIHTVKIHTNFSAPTESSHASWLKQ
jgi:hypothetical protein